VNILVVGGGGREHTLAWKISRSRRADNIFIAPGNAGTALIGENLDIAPNDIEALGKAARERHIDLAVIGPESPLAAGLVDHFDVLGIPAFGPTKAAARIESSKVFARELMLKYGIPTPRGASFSTFQEARKYLEQQQAPLVVKADGLAAGKGTIIATTLEEAQKALGDIMEAKIFGAAGDRVLIDEYRTGREVSLVAFTDGKTVVPMVPACDYKKIGDNDQGPNTGGMGGYSPPGFFSTGLARKAANTVLLAAVKAMAAEGILYKGVLYAGLMLTGEGMLNLEFNARFGDPESQVTLPLLKTDLVDIMMAVIEGRLDRVKIEWSDDACVGVVMSSAGYPGSYKTGFAIKGLDEVDEEALVFHAGTKPDSDGTVRTSGGRVLTVAGVGRDIAEARRKAYANLSRIHFEGCYYRKDIALREVA
jgi:phosphoribosylamine--glycine ligase